MWEFREELCRFPEASGNNTWIGIFFMKQEERLLLKLYYQIIKEVPLYKELVSNDKRKTKRKYFGFALCCYIANSAKIVLVFSQFGSTLLKIQLFIVGESLNYSP